MTSLRIIFISFLLLISITHGSPIESPRDDAQQVETIPFTGVNPTDPRPAHGPDGLRPASAAMAMIIGAAQSKGHDAPGTILTPYEQSHTTPTAPTALFIPPATHATASPTPSFRASGSTPGISPATQSNTSQRNVLVLAIVVSTVLGLLVCVTVGKYTLEYLRKAKRRLRLSQESWGHRERPFLPEVPVPDTEAERQSLKTFSFPGQPARKDVHLYDPNEASSKPTMRTRFSNLIAYTAFRHRDHDSVTTQDTASSAPYLLNVPGHSDHSRTRSAPIITHNDSMATVKPARSTESDWDIARSSYRVSHASANIPSSLLPSRGSRLSRLDSTW
ncbi:hypothetical protein DFJ58DRAFT_725796 [Suillus subalutaceus]|uniref:uncharacterized protein n=1 Tax=Suillus subalutaceus TaxID=48586 RepID=UPI001B87A7AC|nr:uncharacterized protein DFJ58DRAFT_725796 [Suillus subalutaceus]KAG1861102.1 hypothetical protein DFJ58DRAFT_725796 [Suillus subalutaceus]